MGGNLFKLGRLDRAAYLVLEAEIRAYLDAKMGDLYRIPRYYGNKPDFGDLDILVSSAAVQPDWQAYRQEIMADLGIQEYKSVNRVLSTVYKGFQTDFFYIDEAAFQSSYQFLCYNDLGNLLGKLFRRFNLKYGDEGLLYVYRRPDDDHYRHEMLLTRDMGRILGFLGLDIETWERGFDTLEEMFAWVVGSPYFTVKPFLDRAATTEKRVQHRPTMEKFVVWLEKMQVTKAYSFDEDREAYLPMIQAAFPEANLGTQIALENEKHARALRIREKFSGKIVMDLFPGLEGQRLGRFMMHFKSLFADFEGAMDALDADSVRKVLQEQHALWEQGE